MTNILMNRNGKYVKIENADLQNLPANERIWVQLTNPNEIEVNRVIEELKIPEDFVRSALDDEEGPRIDLDDDTQYRLTVFDIPAVQHEEGSDAPYTTMPLAVIQKDNLTVTVCLLENFKFQEIKHGTLRKNVLLDSQEILYQFLLSFHNLYESYLRTIDKSSTRLESKLLQAKPQQTDSNLLELMRLKNSLIYFASSLRQNMIVTEKLLLQKNLHEDDVETLENIAVEIKQAFATCNLQRELMTESMNTYNNMISNQLAERMRFLTIITIILAIPTLIAGIYGMNINLPFDHLPRLGSFFLMILIMVVACILVLIWVTPRRSSLNPPKPKRRRRRERKKQK